MEAMGKHYDRAVESEDRFIAIRTFEEFDEKIAEENDYWLDKKIKI